MKKGVAEMPRARNIKPAFFTNEELVELPMSDRLLFIGLWTLADREGRLEDRPKRIKMSLFPADDINVDEALSRLQGAGFIQRYQVDGNNYMQIANFTKHQNPHHKEAPSNIPSPVKTGASPRQAHDKVGADRADILIPDILIPDSCKNKSRKRDDVPKPDGVSDQTWSDFKKHRNGMKAPVTKTALEGITKSAEKANMTLEEVMRLMMERGWRGFKPSWVDADKNSNQHLSAGGI